MGKPGKLIFFKSFLFAFWTGFFPITFYYWCYLMFWKLTPQNNEGTWPNSEIAIILISCYPFHASSKQLLSGCCKKPPSKSTFQISFWKKMQYEEFSCWNEAEDYMHSKSRQEYQILELVICLKSRKTNKPQVSPNYKIWWG